MRRLQKFWFFLLPDRLNSGVVEQQQLTIFDPPQPGITMGKVALRYRIGAITAKDWCIGAWIRLKLRLMARRGKPPKDTFPHQRKLLAARHCALPLEKSNNIIAIQGQAIVGRKDRRLCPRRQRRQT